MAAAPINLVVGVWLIGSPFFVFFDPDVDEYWNPIACGVTIAVLSLTRLLSGSTWPSWVNAAVGLWLFASAFWLADSNQASWNNALSGAAVFVLALVSASAGRERTPTTRSG